MFSPTVGATDFIVTKTADTADGSCDSSDCSLREAVIAANSQWTGTGPHTISIPQGTYTLTIEAASADEGDASAGDLDVSFESLTIRGAPQGGTVIDGNEIDRVFEITGTSVTIQDLTIQGGKARPAATGGGGGIDHSGGTLTLSNVTLTGNTANGGGGGISTRATALVIEDSFITENEASNGPSGISSQTPDVRISGTTFADNGLVLASHLNVIGIDAYDVADVTLENCTFDSNDGTALQILQILDQTTVTVENCTFYGHQDAAIDIEFLDYLTMTITNSTLSGSGAGINVGSGALNEGSVTLKNSILAGSGADCSGSIVSGGNNLIGDPTGCTVTLQSSDLTGEACLGSFTNFGEAGQGVILLVTGSPAIDAGDDSVCVGDLELDQRGMARSGSCDMGAFEWTSSCGGSCVGTCDLGNEEGEESEGGENENNEGDSGGGCSLIPAGPLLPLSPFLPVTRKPLSLLPLPPLLPPPPAPPWQL